MAHAKDRAHRIGATGDGDSGRGNRGIRRASRLAALILATLAGPASCSPSDDALIVYTALDRSFSEPIFERFTAETGIEVRAAYDTEAQKTVGLTNRIREERRRPRCDVFWNNEILNTLLLDADGLLEAVEVAAAEAFPAAYRDPTGRWYGFAARARVLIVNTEIVPAGDRPDSIEDLADPRWRGETGIAKPLFGTTASHVACLFSTLGEERAKALLRRFRDNDIVVFAGNKGCARAVADGDIAFALTDTDDAIIELDAGHPVEIVYPDTGAGEMGTLFLPNTLAVVKGTERPEDAARLVGYLLTPDVERRLAEGPSAQIPLHPESPPNPRVRGPGEVRAMDVDFVAAAKAFPAARAWIESEFLAP